MMQTVIAGAAGRMGSALIQAVCEADDFELSGAVEAPGHPAVGQDAGQVAGVAATGVVVTADPAAVLARADVLIDFSFHEAAPGNARAACEAGSAVVIGTTGLTAAEQTVIAELATAGNRIVLAPNMSVGVNLMFHLCGRVAKVLGEAYDIEVVEMHHNQKRDAPSGTAVRLAEILAETMDMSYAENVRHGRQGMVGARPSREIGMHALRGGDVVGDHTVIFATAGERVELVHKASSRATFANGALRAARFLMAAEAGLYDMQDVLGLRAG
jgi:4-hydroxy-tetrahydrodipicolinate reductase